MNYSKKLNHGEAVILGIYSALRFSLVNKIISFSEFNIIKNHLDKTKLSYDIKKFFTQKDTQKIISYMQKDKKNNSEKINLILLKKIGSVDFEKKFGVKQIKLFISKILKN